MWSVLIGLVLSVTIGILLHKKYPDSWQAPTAFTILIIAALGFPLGLSFTAPYHEVLTTKQIDLVAIKDNTLIDGRIGGGIFLVSSYIRESPVYFYYKKVGSGYVQDHIKAKSVIIYEDSKEGEGYITMSKKQKVVHKEWADKYLHWIIFAVTYISPHSEITEIHVPKGTIIKEFVLDAE